MFWALKEQRIMISKSIEQAPPFSAVWQASLPEFRNIHRLSARPAPRFISRMNMLPISTKMMPSIK